VHLRTPSTRGLSEAGGKRGEACCCAIVRLELAKLRLELAKSCWPMLLKHLRDTLVRLELAKTCCAMCA